MAIDRVTITGADDSVHASDLVVLSKEFPFVEWAILASESNTRLSMVRSRYPSIDWLANLQANMSIMPDDYPRMALHINGRWVRELLLGRWHPLSSILLGFQRVQLNFHAEKCKCDPRAFAEVLSTHFVGKDIIFQLDGADGNAYLDVAYEHGVRNCYGLFDVSGGAGILPSEWPKPIYLDVHPGEHGMGVEQHAYHGYAGGLGPDNLAEEISKILAAAAGTEHTQEGRIWIDMETRVRSNDDRQFDLAKVRKCLEIAAPYITKG